jgi:phosphatidylglycerophosphate synthase
VIWQLAFGLDCADGLLARSRNLSSSFGAWADQLADFGGHLLITASLTLLVVRELELAPIAAVQLTAVITGASTLQIFATSQRDSTFGRQPKGDSVTGRMRALLPAIHLVDYGFFLFVSALLILAPLALLAFLLLSSILSFAFVAAQIAIFWRSRAER